MTADAVKAANTALQASAGAAPSTKAFGQAVTDWIVAHDVAPPPPPPPPPVPTGRLFNRVSFWSPTIAGVTQNASRYSHIAVASEAPTLVTTALKAAGTMPLIYKNTAQVGTQTASGASPNVNYALNKTEASAWLTGATWNGGLMGKIGDPAYQAAWATNAAKAAQAGGFGGVFIDDLRYKGMSPLTEADQLSFLKGIYPPLHAAGLLVFGNIGSVSDTHMQTVMPTWWQYLDGWMDEGVGRASVAHTGARDGGDRVQNRINLIQASEAAGKVFMGEIPADDGDLDTITYGFANFLLASKCEGLSNLGVIGTAPNFSHEVWTSVHDKVLRLGLPTGPYTGSVTTSYGRSFQHGRVDLDPALATATILA